MRNYLDNLPKPFLALAPLDDVTDTVFRRVIASLAPPDLFFTEFTNVDALTSAGRQATLKRLSFTPQEQPLIAQIWGKNPENFYKATQEIAEMGFVGVDLNMGCPDKAVVKNGCCSGLIRDRAKALEIIQATQRAAKNKIPVSVKTRLGFAGYDKEWLELLLKQKLNMLTIHLRTVKEMSKVHAHWELMSEIKSMRDKISPTTALVGNGDVESKQQAVNLAKKYRIDGIMIGRGVFHDPFVFADKSQWTKYAPSQKVELYKSHIKLFKDTWQDNEKPAVVLNKFCKIYINDFAGAKDIRARLMSAKSIDELQTMTDQIIKTV